MCSQDGEPPTRQKSGSKMEDYTQDQMQNGTQANLIRNHVLLTYTMVTTLWNAGFQSVTHVIISPFLFFKEIFPLCKWFQCSYIINLLKTYRPHCLIGPLNPFVLDCGIWETRQRPTVRITKSAFAHPAAPRLRAPQPITCCIKDWHWSLQSWKPETSWWQSVCHLDQM